MRKLTAIIITPIPPAEYAAYSFANSITETLRKHGHTVKIVFEFVEAGAVITKEVLDLSELD